MEFEKELESLINKHGIENIVIAYTDIKNPEPGIKQTGGIGTFVKGKLKALLLESLQERLGVNSISTN